MTFGISLALTLLIDSSLSPLWLANLLPDDATCRSFLILNVEHSKYLKTRMIPGPRQDALLHLHCKHYAWWDTVADIRMGRWDEIRRRQKLAWVIEKIGWERFWQMEWPMPIPVDEE